MNTYILCYIILCFLAIVSSGFKQKGKTFLFVCCCAMLLVLLCFRDVSVGADTQTYCQYFKLFQTNSWKTSLSVSWEPGFVVLSKLLGYIFSDQRAFIIIMGLINAIPLFIIIRHKSCNPIMSLILFYTTLFTSAEYLYRQWIALLLLFLSYKYVIHRKPIRFLLVVGVAALFHRTALVFVVVYALYNVKISSVSLYVAGIISIFFLITGAYWRDFFNMFVRIELSDEFRGGVPMFLLLWAIVLLVYIFSRERLQNPWFKLQFILLLVAAATQPLAFSFSIWSRILLYFRLSIIFLLPQTIKDVLSFKQNYVLLIPVYGVFYGVWYLYYLIVVQDWGQFVFMSF